MFVYNVAYVSACMCVVGWLGRLGCVFVLSCRLPIATRCYRFTRIDIHTQTHIPHILYTYDERRRRTVTNANVHRAPFQSQTECVVCVLYWGALERRLMYSLRVCSRREKKVFWLGAYRFRGWGLGFFKDRRWMVSCLCFFPFLAAATATWRLDYVSEHDDTAFHGNGNGFSFGRAKGVSNAVYVCVAVVCFLLFGAHALQC